MGDIRVFLADDHKLFREGLQSLLLRTQGIDVVGQSSTGRETIQRAKAIVPEVILMDLSMPQTNGTEATRYIKKFNPKIKIIALTAYQSQEYVRATLDAGADGYVLKEDSHHILIDAIYSVKNGKTFLSPGICDKVIDGYLGRSSDCSICSSDKLTAREREVIKLIAEGMKNQEIADYLSLSNKTIEKHRASLMKKLDLHGVSALTIYAIEHDLVACRHN
jgi:DNA-binding NarL/FixJ family response regulator